MYNNSPEYFGPGYWISWHLKAYKANTYEKKVEVSRSIVIDVSNLPCMTCRKDALDYIRKNQLMSIVNDKDPLSIFKWTINFHNHVNRKLNKPIFELSELDNKYSKANIKAIYNNFFIIFASNSNTPQLMSAAFHRQHNLPKIKIALDKIISKFD